LTHPKRAASAASATADAAEGPPPTGAAAHQGELDDDEVLRVLVARPQVASKPRDNIIFEGDMDLRTTFETSYEALARKRLEQWRRHQELRARRERPETRPPAADWRDVSDKTDCRQDERDKDAAGATVGRGGVLAAGQHHCGEAEAPAARADDVGGARETGRAASADDEPVGSRPVGSALDASTPPPRKIAAAGAGTAEPTTIKRPDPLRNGAESKQQPAVSPAGSQRGRPSASPLAEHRKHQPEPFIDPDLSPIIVYDANLNRLERVGLRKRSKYRPSTSLRPGGRDFFGQVEVDGGGASEGGRGRPAASDTNEQISANNRGGRVEQGRCCSGPPGWRQARPLARRMTSTTCGRP
jgi:hypothetical protein